MTDLINQTLGQYRLIEQIGQGGMATVYKAHQPGLDRYVALKILPALQAKQSGFSERFQREAKAIANLHHPNILPVYDFGQDGEFSFLIMRYIEGARTLEDVMAGSLSQLQIADLIGQVGGALDHAHRQGIIHRDVKPGNVLMDGDWALLSDFGLAKILESSEKLTGTGVGLGTPAYMAPEQGEGRIVDRRADIYALGVILFEMLTGRIPHDAETPFAIIINRLQEPPPSARSLNRSLPEAADRVVLQALARQPENRYGSAGELASAFREAIGQVVVETPVAVVKKQSGASSPGRVTSSFVRPKPPVRPDPGRLEQQYRERLKARYAEEAAYYVPLVGETSEVVSRRETPAPRSTRRRRRRAQAAYHKWIESGQEIKRVKLETLREAVDRYACIILLGDPGSGKTTALENLAYQFADQPDRLPIPLHLSEFGPGMSLNEFIRQGWGGSLEADHWGASELAAGLEDYLEAGKLFFLFDALNEMPHEGYRERARALRRFIDQWSAKENRFLVTCRVLDYGEELSGLQRVEVQPLSDELIRIFLQHELPEDWSILWQTLAEPGDSQYRLLDMARNPYLLTVMIDVFAEDGQLGRNRAELMERFTQILMGWVEAKTPADQWLDPAVQREALSVLAFEMQARSGFGSTVKTEQVKMIMPHQIQLDPNWPPQPTPPDQILTLAASANIIEMPVDRVTVRFYHQLLQEYFAAHQMLARGAVGSTGFARLSALWKWPWLETEMPFWNRPRDNHEPLPPPPFTGWEETTILAAGLIPENDDQLMRALLKVNPVLAGRCLTQGQARVDRTTRQAVIDRLLSTIARPEVALRVRIAAGEVLGYLGDPRLGEMVVIPAGEFLMGEGREQHELFLAEYQIGKYPLTNAEYRHFVEAGGYRDERWWTDMGRREISQKQDEPRLWPDARFNKPNQPALGLSWYECVAYCRWLSAETGRLVRLPTEAEWEKGARGGDGRVYPWGDQFEAGRLNARAGEQQVRTSTPVGIYPAGANPFGLFDCAGNVWEWCATRWKKPFPYNAQQDEWQVNYLEGQNLRVLRGGSWNYEENVAHCGYRLKFQPYGWNDRGGCRLVSPI